MCKSNVFLILVFVIIDTCLKAEPTRGRLELMNRLLLHQNFSRCADTRSDSYVICEIHDEKDAKAIGYDCAFYNHQCPDGSYNRTCMLLYINPDDPDRFTFYTCTCHSNKQPQLQPWHYHWSKWESLTGGRVGMHRELTDTMVANPPVLIREYRYVL